MKLYLILVMLVFGAQNLFAKNKLFSCAISIDTQSYSDSYENKEVTESAEIFTRENKRIFKGSQNDAMEFIRENPINGFLLVFSFNQPSNVYPYVIDFKQILPQSGNSSSEIVPESLISFTSAELPFTFVIQSKGLDVACEPN